MKSLGHQKRLWMTLVSLVIVLLSVVIVYADEGSTPLLETTESTPDVSHLSSLDQTEIKDTRIQVDEAAVLEEQAEETTIAAATTEQWTMVQPAETEAVADDATTATVMASIDSQWIMPAVVVMVGSVLMGVVATTFKKRRAMSIQRDEQDQMLRSLLYSDLDYAAM